MENNYTYYHNMQHVMISRWCHYPTINDSWSTAKIFCMRFK